MDRIVTRHPVADLGMRSAIKGSMDSLPTFTKDMQVECPSSVTELRPNCFGHARRHTCSIGMVYFLIHKGVHILFPFVYGKLGWKIFF